MKMNFRERLAQSGVFFRKGSKLVTGALVAGAVLATNSSAAGITVAPIDTADFNTIALAIIAAMGAVWAIKQGIKLLRN